MSENRQERPARQFLRLFFLWLRAPDRGTARWLIFLLLALTCAQVVVQIRFNLWNRDFFNALENRDSAAFRNQILVFLLLAAASMAAAVYQLYFKQLIQLRWREWLTGYLLEGWLRDGRQYQLELLESEADNPDQRIAEDVRIATDLAVEFVTGLLNSLLMFVAFVGILWTLSGPLHVAFSGIDISIPGYMVWAALLYATLGTTLTWWVGRPMVALNVERTTREADFRFAMVRARESGEGIAFVGGEADERRGIQAGFGRVRDAVQALMRSQRNLMWLTSAYGTLAMIFPTIVASPGYFAGVITLGGLMQIGAAFGQVQAALNWFVNNVSGIAEWRSAVERLAVFEGAVAQLSGLADRPIRWITEDARRFVAREVRRGRRYDAILLDPPKFGRGPEGEVWDLTAHLPALLADCVKLLDADSRFLILTTYAVRLSALALDGLLTPLVAGLPGRVQAGEMTIREERRGLLLPTAIFARWSR